MRFYIIIFLLIGAASLATSQSRILGAGNFDKYGVGNSVPGFNKDVTLKEEDGMLFLAFMPKQRIFTKVPHSAKSWNNYEFKFDIRFATDNIWVSPYVKSYGSRPEINYLWYYIGIHKDTVTITQHGGMPEERKKYAAKALFKSANLKPVQPGQWYTFKIIVTDNIVSVYRNNEANNLVKVLTAKVAPGGGYTCMLTHCQIDLANLTVIKINNKVLNNKK